MTGLFPEGVRQAVVNLATHKTTVEVRLGAQISHNPQLNVGNLSEEVEVTGSARSIDPTSSRSATNITTEQIQNLPKSTRAFHGLLAMAPGVLLEPKSGSAGVGGVQVGGSSGAENAFFIDGTEVSDLRRGSLRESNSIPFEFVQEVQVKTGGINAEYGGALGGVVSAVTKSGGNRLQGELHYYVTGSPLSAGPVRRLVLSPSDETTVSFVHLPPRRSNDAPPTRRHTGCLG